MPSPPCVSSQQVSLWFSSSPTGLVSTANLFLSHSLKNKFAIKDLVKLSYILGLEVSYTYNGLFLIQGKYAYDVLSRAGLLDSKPVGTPLATNDIFSTIGTPFHDSTLY